MCMAWPGPKAIYFHIVCQTVMVSCCPCRHQLCWPCTLATMVIGQHAVSMGKSITVPSWTLLWFSCKKWNSLQRCQRGQVRYANAAAGLSNDWVVFSCFKFCYPQCVWKLVYRSNLPVSCHYTLFFMMPDC